MIFLLLFYIFGILLAWVGFYKMLTLHRCMNPDFDEVLYNVIGSFSLSLLSWIGVIFLSISLVITYIGKKRAKNC